MRMTPDSLRHFTCKENIRLMKFCSIFHLKISGNPTNLAIGKYLTRVLLLLKVMMSSIFRRKSFIFPKICFDASYQFCDTCLVVFGLSNTRLYVATCATLFESPRYCCRGLPALRWRQDTYNTMFAPGC